MELLMCDRNAFKDLAIATFIGFLLVSKFSSCSFKARFAFTVCVAFGVMFGFHLLALPTVGGAQLGKFLKGLKVGAHRGLAWDAPENTLAAFKLSKALGADAVEFDLEFTKDGVPVVLHDHTVDRTTNGTGNIGRLTYAEISGLNAAAKFPNTEKYPFEKIPTLNEFIDVCLGLNVKIIVDIKGSHPALVDTVTTLFRQHEILYEKAAVCSFFPNIIYAIKRADPKIITGHTWRPYFLTHTDYSRSKPYYSNSVQLTVMEWLNEFYVWNLHKWIWKITGANLILTEKHSISWQYIKMWQERGVQVVAWTVNDYYEKLSYLNELKCPFLTDRLSDIQEELQTHSDKEFCSKDQPCSTSSGNDVKILAS